VTSSAETWAPDRWAPVRDGIEQVVHREAVDGAAVAIALAGERVVEYGFGVAAPGQPVTSETLWAVGSITKLYTAATVMALVERGVLTLSTPVHAILPTFTGEGRERVTMRHLLTHTSGLAYQSPAMAQRLMALTPLNDLVDEAYTLPLCFPPGTDWRYSDLGYALAGRMAAAAAGAPLPDLVQRLVLDAGDLAETFLPPPREAYPRIARVTGAQAEGSRGDMYNSPYARDLAHPAFGAVATVRDLLRFGLLFAPTGQRYLLSEAVRQTMTTDQVGAGSQPEPDSPPPGKLPAWGIGFMVKGPAGYPALASPVSFGHSGATGCVLWIDPAYDAVVAFASNRHALADPVGVGHPQRAEQVVNAALACLTRGSSGDPDELSLV
jgi:CubicO group peptidase (beta-lactamase class C family)